MIINNAENYCSGEGDVMARMGNLNGLEGVRSDFFLDMNTSSYNNANNHNNSVLSRHPEEMARRDCRNAFVNYSQGTTPLQQQDQFSGRYEKQRHFSDYGNAVINNSFGGLNQTSTVISVCSSAGSQALSSNSVPSSPVTIISVPSPIELKPNLEELDGYRRHSQMQQGTIVGSPPQSSSPTIEEVVGYFHPSPSAQSYQQQSSEQIAIQQDGNCYRPSMSAINYPSSQSCISSVAGSQSSLSDMNSFPQYRCSTSVVSSPSYLSSEVNSAVRFESPNYQGYIHQTHNSLPMSGNSLAHYNVDYISPAETQQTNLCDGNQQSLADFETANFEDSTQFQSNNTSQSIVSKQKARPKKGGKSLRITEKIRGGLRDEQLIDMSVRELNRHLRGLR